MSLNEVWEAASETPFIPLVGKDTQFTVGFNLLLVGKLPAYRSSENNHSLTNIASTRDRDSLWLEYVYYRKLGQIEYILTC
jgi:hypothetical protein